MFTDLNPQRGDTQKACRVYGMMTRKVWVGKFLERIDIRGDQKGKTAAKRFSSTSYYIVLHISTPRVIYRKVIP